MMVKPAVAYTRGDVYPMQVANMTFLVNKLGEDCSPLQYIRELTKNGIEAIQQRGDGKGGEVVWDVYWPHLDLEGAIKLCCIDTGIGMSGEEMVQYINSLSSSVHQQSATGNFGVGAKIAAAPRNPHGLVYMSWKDGVGHMVHLWFDPDAQVYGLKRWPKNKEFWTPVSNDLKPKEIGENGTVVVLLGRSDDDNTVVAPDGTPMPSRWILRYLNSRFFRFPKGVVARSREGWELPRGDKHNFLREVTGQGVWLDANSQARGVLDLTDARAHWWILKPEVDIDSGHYTPSGHVAALYQDELYELAYSRAGLARLHAFGVIFGADRVVVYVEPHVTKERPVTANTARTQLLIQGEPLDWPRWATEFRDHMPDDLVRLQEEIGAKAGERDHKKAILERLKQIKDLLKFSRFRPSKNSPTTIDPESGAGGSDGSGKGAPRDTARDSGKRGGRSGDLYALFAEDSDVTGEPVDTLNEPKTQWVSVEDGTRTPPDLDDRAAKFLIQQNLLMINADFRVFTDMVERWVHAYAHVPGAKLAVKEVAHEWFEQQLIETVMSAQALKSTGKWSLQELERLWEEEALTAAVLPRWHIDQSIKRNLGHRLGSLKAA
jgi:hypothetical protein